ncbi:hypothetical protein Tco_1297716 [Tanacetum coccineum]
MHDNIVPKPDLALELGKSISLTESEEEAIPREVYATHARTVSESEPEPTQRRQFGIAFIDSFIVLGIPDESTVVSRASSEGTGSKPGVPDEEKLIIEWEAITPCVFKSLTMSINPQCTFCIVRICFKS